MIYDKLYILRNGVPNYCLVDIDGWDVDAAKAIIANYDNVYGFRFQRRLWVEEREPGRYNVTARIMKESGTYYVNGFIETLDDLRAHIELDRKERRTQDDKVLLQKMESHGYKAVVKGIKHNWCCFFNEETDILL
jgi:hypothetical protein